MTGRGRTGALRAKRSPRLPYHRGVERYDTLPGWVPAAAGAGVLAASAAAWVYLDYRIEARFTADQLFGNVEAIPARYAWILGGGAAAGAILLGLVAFLGVRTRSARTGLPAWSPAGRRAAWALALPTGCGAAFGALLLLRFDLFGLVAPVSLLFPGLGLMAAAAHGPREFAPLGAAMALTGLAATWFPRESLPFWAIGFGILPLLAGLAIARRQARGR